MVFAISRCSGVCDSLEVKHISLSISEVLYASNLKGNVVLST